MKEEKIGHCTFCHHDACEVKIVYNPETFELEEAQRPWGDPYPPDGYIEGCPKARALREIQTHPDRLNYPLKRKGERGSNTWERISWDQALDEIAEKLSKLSDKFGPETLGCIDGVYGENWASQRFFHLFGSPNAEASMSRVCKGDLRSVQYAMLGSVCLYGPPTSRCKLVVLWGSKHSTSGLIMWQGERMVQFRGGKHIVIDPRCTSEAKMADIHLQLRPGTDTALGMGWLNVIINENLYDKDFVEKWTVGFDKLKERVKKFTPKRVAEITWVPEDKIVESARMYATTKPASINWGTKPSCRGRGETEAERVRSSLRAITGNLDIDGGDLFQEPNPGLVPFRDLEMPEMLSPDQREKALGSETIKLKLWPGWHAIAEVRKKHGMGPMPTWGQYGADAPHLFQAMITGKPYPVKAFFVVGANPMVTMADTKKVYEALKKLDLLVVLDIFKTPTGILADYLLPGTSWMECPQIAWVERHESILGGDRCLPKKIDGEYDRGDCFDFWRGLGVRLGQKEHWPWETLEENIEFRLKPSGITWEQFRKRPWVTPGGISEKHYEKWGAFPTPSGKVELYSSIYKELGYDPLPYWDEPAESPVSTPDLAKEYPLIMMNGARIQQYLHSQFRDIRSLRSKVPDPLVEIHPETAKNLGIKDGDWVWIENQRGRVKQRCEVTDIVDPRVVHASYGWWFPEKPAAEPSLFGVWESNINVLTSLNPDHQDKAAGGWYLSPMLCKVYKVED